MPSDAMATRWRQLLSWLGPLRLMFFAGVLAMAILRPAPGTPPVYSGWDMFPTLVAPALVPLFFMVLLLDAIMSAVQAASRPGARRRYRTVIGLDLSLALGLLLWWWGYFSAIIP